MSDFAMMLQEMGFEKNQAERGVAETGSVSVEAALEWILAHEDDDGAGSSTSHDYVQNLTASLSPSSSLGVSGLMSLSAGDFNPDVTVARSECLGSEHSTGDDTPSEPLNADMTAKSIQCDTCKQLFKSGDEVEIHALRTGHTDYGESLEEKKPMMEEERQALKKRLEALLKEKRLLREKAEEAAAVEAEKKRILMGRDISEAKRKYEESEMKKAMEERKREKQEEKLYREGLKALIEREKLARDNADAPPVAKVEETKVASPKPLPDSTLIKIKLPGGKTFMETFHSRETLAAVRVFIEMKRENGEINPIDLPGPFHLAAPFPRHVYADNEYGKSLAELNLVPSAMLMLILKSPGE